jgi:hypothetical protein
MMPEALMAKRTNWMAWGLSAILAGVLSLILCVAVVYVLVVRCLLQGVPSSALTPDQHPRASIRSATRR